MSQLPGRARSDDDDDDDGRTDYLTLAELAAYSRLSVSTLKRYLGDPNPLPHLQVGEPGSTRGRLLFRKKEFDAWMERFRPGRAAPAGPDFSWIKSRG